MAHKICKVKTRYLPLSKAVSCVFSRQQFSVFQAKKKKNNLNDETESFPPATSDVV